MVRCARPTCKHGSQRHVKSKGACMRCPCPSLRLPKDYGLNPMGAQP